jgi:hypothetical protein
VIISAGTVHVLAGGSANVTFLSSGSGSLIIDDTASRVSAFLGTVSGFGGVNHTNHKQFIDLTSVTFASGQIHLSYTSSAGSGTLFVSSGATLVAQVNMIGSYTSANFSARADGSGSLEIFDPMVVNGGSVAPGLAQTLPRHGIDLSDISFGAQTTLAYAVGATGAGCTLTISSDRHVASIALLGNYMAGSFVITADGHDRTLIREGETGPPLLAHPRA